MEEIRIFLLRRKDWTAEEIADRAVKALIYEVSISPKAGLVTRHSNGSHRDMNFFHFLDSSLALRSYFEKAYRHREYYVYGEESFFQELRLLGKEAEGKMYAATKGVNTHKGTIFAMGILLATLGALWEKEEELSLEHLSLEIASLCKSLQGELGKEIDGSKGEKAYQSYGMSGARGLALAGYDLVLLEGLARFLEAVNRLELEEASMLQLFYYMGELEDTNIVSRSNKEVLAEVQRRSKELYEKNILSFEKTEIRKDMEELNQFFLEQNISAGGSADLLIVTLFIYFLLEG